MDGNDPYPRHIQPNEQTLDAPSLLTLSEGGEQSSGPKVHLVEGSGPQLSGETRDLLRTRLRTSALLLFAAFAAFLVWHLVAIDFSRTSHLILFPAHAVVTLCLGVMGASMCRTCPMTTTTLRLKELVIFGLPAAYFVLMSWITLPYFAETYGLLPPPVPAWMVLIFIYAMFIPNTWQRASLVIGPLALAPVLLVTGLWIFNEPCRNCLENHPMFLPEVILIMAVAAISGVVGVFTINNLRQEAFQAKRLGQYNLRQLIGAGGMGEVYLAEHRLLKRPCAIKLIRPDMAGDDKTLARFEREVKSSANLSHWNSIEIFDYGHAEDGTFYYVMEFLPGMNLQDIVQRFGPLVPERVIHLLMQTCDALGEAHEMCLVHRDIKPANIFAAFRGGQHDVAKLLDFGLVKPLSSNENAQLTQEGTITGSPLYMSPEQGTGDSEPDARSDIYSLGAVAYYLLTGRPPFDYKQPIKVLLAHSQEIPVPPSEIQEDVPPDLESVVMKCLEKDPADRFQDVYQLRDALADCESAGHWTLRLAAAWWQSNGVSIKTPQPVEA